MLKYWERSDEKWCKSKRKTEERPRKKATEKSKRMMKITRSSTKITNEAWRRVRRMRSKLGNIMNVILIKPRHALLVVKGGR